MEPHSQDILSPVPYYMHMKYVTSFPGHSEPHSILYKVCNLIPRTLACLLWAHVFCGMCTSIHGVKGLGKLILVEEGNPANTLVCVERREEQRKGGRRGAKGRRKEGREKGREEEREEEREEGREEGKRGEREGGGVQRTLCFLDLSEYASNPHTPLPLPSPHTQHTVHKP